MTGATKNRQNVEHRSSFCSEDIAAVLSDGRADAALAASIFHYGEMTVGELKGRLREMNINVRM